MMNFGFLLLNPARLMIDKYVGLALNMDNKKFVENFVRMEKWIFDSPDLPGEVFRQFIKDCYQGNKLIQNKLIVGGKRVDLGNLTMPLLNIYGKFDHLVPPEACSSLVAHVGSKDAQDICLDTGHIGIYVSSKCQEAFAPKIARWLMARDGCAPATKRLHQSPSPQITSASKRTPAKLESSQRVNDGIGSETNAMDDSRQVING
jgi:polyhydroxyalkanoate synthase